MNDHRDSDTAVIYEIRLKGYLPVDWSHWFDGMAITHDDAGHTLLTGPVVDQAALHGLLDKVRDLGLPLLAVEASQARELESVSPQSPLFHGGTVGRMSRIADPTAPDAVPWTERRHPAGRRARTTSCERDH